jgi:hypothetical protein
VCVPQILTLHVARIPPHAAGRQYPARPVARGEHGAVRRAADPSNVSSRFLPQLCIYK